MNYKLKLLALIIVALLINVSFIGLVQAGSDSKGDRFFLAFSPNYTNSGTPALYITSESESAGVVSVPGIGFSVQFVVPANDIVKVELPKTVRQMPSNKISQLGITVQTDKEVTVYALNPERYSTDAFLVLPVDVLGLEYILMSYDPTYSRYPSELAITGVYDNTVVTITPSDQANGRPAGQPFTVTLSNAETFLLTSSGDLTGSIVTASSPVAVTGGVNCVNVPRRYGWCDHIVEMMPPVSTWGKSFLTVPLATRKRGDVFRVLASQDNTDVVINGAVVANLARGEYFETFLLKRSSIQSNEPVLVAQYSVGQSYDGVVSDPFMMLVPPTEQFLDSYIFSAIETNSKFINNYVNIVISSVDVDEVTLDGIPVNSELFLPIGDTEFSGAQVKLSFGSHAIRGSVPFGIYVYGFGSYDSYGYPGGMAFDSINMFGDKYPPNLKIIELDGIFYGTASDNEDLNLNGILEPAEDINGNGLIDRRTEDLNGNGALDPGEDTNADGVLDRDSGIFRIELSSSSMNLLLKLESFVPGSLQVNFEVSIIDPAQPASGSVTVTDGVGNSVTKMLNISNEKRLTNVRVVSTLASTNVELDQASFVKSPYSINVSATETRIEWRYDSIEVGQAAALDYEVILVNPVPGEERLVTSSLDLYYLDVNGDEVHSGLGQQTISVLPSIFNIALDTDKSVYGPAENVVINTQVSNLSRFDESVNVALSIHDANGALVTEYTLLPNIFIDAEGSLLLPEHIFFSGDVYEGLYEVRAKLLDGAGDMIMMAVASLVIVSPVDNKLAALVSTDKQSYGPLDSVNVRDRIRNTTLSAILEGYTAHTTVYEPGGDIFWTGNSVLPQMLPGALHDIDYNVALNSAEAGIYKVVLVVTDADQIARTMAETTFEVLSTAQIGNGLVGQVTVNPNSVYRHEYVDLNVSVENAGNAELLNLPVTLSITDPASESVLVEWTQVVSELGIQEQYPISQRWQVIGPLPGAYVAVLSAQIDDKTRYLSFAPFTVLEKIQSKVNVGDHGRVLILIDQDNTTEGVSCRGVSAIEFASYVDAPWVTNAKLSAQLSDGVGLIDSEVTALNAGAGLINNNASVGDAELSITTHGGPSSSLVMQTVGDVLTGNYTLGATVTDGTNVVNLQSGIIEPRCDTPLTIGDVYGDFVLSGLTISPAANDPHGPGNAPSPGAQRMHLETLLATNNWSYTIVTNGDDFARELRTGGYVTYLLLSEQAKLSEQTQNELRAAVYRGEGLIETGRHDQRNGRIDDALGIKYIGKHSDVNGINLISSTSPQKLLFKLGTDKALKVEIGDSQALGYFIDQKGSLTADVAITVNNYGHGVALYAGFDLLAESAAAGVLQNPYATLLLESIGRVQPTSLEPLPGAVLPLTLGLTNFGLATPGRTLTTIFPAATVVDPGSFTFEDDNTLQWLFMLDENAADQNTFWLGLPLQRTTININTLIQTGTDPNFLDYSNVAVNIDMEAAPGFGDLLALLTALGADYDRVRKIVVNADASASAGDIQQALKLLSQAFDVLKDIGTLQAADARLQVARTMRTIALMLN